MPTAIKPGSVPVNWAFWGTALGILVALLTVLGYVSAFGRGSGEQETRIRSAEKALDSHDATQHELSKDISELKAGVKVLEERTKSIQSDVSEIKDALKR